MSWGWNEAKLDLVRGGKSSEVPWSELEEMTVGRLRWMLQQLRSEPTKHTLLPKGYKGLKKEELQKLYREKLKKDTAGKLTSARGRWRGSARRDRCRHLLPEQGRRGRKQMQTSPPLARRRVPLACREASLGP